MLKTRTLLFALLCALSLCNSGFTDLREVTSMDIAQTPSLVLQVSMAGGTSFAEGFTMQQCWVSLLSSRLPVLAVAVDDALLACADRLIEHWRKPGVSSFTSLAAALLCAQSSILFLHSACRTLTRSAAHDACIWHSVHEFDSGKIVKLHSCVQVTTKP